MTENLRPTNLRAQARESLRGKWGEAALVSLIMAVILSVCAGATALWNIPYWSHTWQTSSLIDGGHMTETYSWGLNHRLYNNWGSLLSLFVCAPLSVGVRFLFLDVARGAAVRFETIGEAFKHYGRYIIAIIIVGILTFLWTLLFIVPGIVKALSYSMTYFIMRENPDMSGNEARKESMRMMAGHKAELFWLWLSFFGWAILCLLTLCIGFLWLSPYVRTSVAKFWEALKAGE